MERLRTDGIDPFGPQSLGNEYFQESGQEEVDRIKANMEKRLKEILQNQKVFSGSWDI